MSKLQLVVITGLTAVVATAFLQQDRFTVVLLPDTQFYALNDPATYTRQTTWIRDNRPTLNIRTAIHLGDITDKNQTDEWDAASAAHKVLDDAGIPYSVTTGNHDLPSVHGESRRKRDPARFNGKFPSSRFSGRAFEGLTWYGGNYLNRSENNYTYFRGGPLDFIVLSLEYAPPKDAMCWANQVLAMPAHRSRRAILATHCYQTVGGGHNRSCDIDKDRNLVGADGAAIWNEVVRQNPNIFLVVSGHVNDSEHKIRSRETGAFATPATRDSVHEILTDYQGQRGTHATPPKGEDHGNGWLRTLEFIPSQSLVRVTTTSVLNATTFAPTWNRFNSSSTHVDHRFDFKYNMNANPPTARNNPIAEDEIRFADRVVNSKSAGHQRAPALGADSDGNWVAVWEDDQGGATRTEVHVRGLDAMGCERFSDVVANTSSTGRQNAPAIAVRPNGDFVLVWEDDGGDGRYQIKARGFTAGGQPRFGEITVNQHATGQQRRPSVAIDGAGDFIVVWEDDAGEDGYYQIEARRFSAGGTPAGNDFTVNTVSDGQQRHPSVAVSANGNAVIVWQDDGGDGKYQIKTRGFRKNGNQLFSQRTVNSVASGQQLKPAVASDVHGDFVVVWEDDAGNNGFYQIKARGFTSTGAQRFAQRTVNAVADGQQRDPSIAMIAGGNAASRGNFVVTWEDDTNNNNFYQIKARGFTANGTPLMAQTTINRNSRGQQIRPAAAFGPHGRFIVVWQDDLEENGYWEVLGRGCTLTAKCEWP